MASILVSGKLALQANSDRHLTASWKESMVAEKYFSKMVAAKNDGNITKAGNR